MRRIFHGFEFYTTPAPGDFNSDSFVDFMIILNYGKKDISKKKKMIHMIIKKRKRKLTEFSFYTYICACFELV